MIRLLVALYPEAWRERYGDELVAMLDETGCGPRVTVDVLRGAVLAHLRSLGGVADSDRARLAVSGVLGCFICFCFAVAGFSKTIEDPPFRVAGDAHLALGRAHQVIVLAVIVAAGALAAAAVPLARRALAVARDADRRDVRLLVATPPLAIGVFVASLALLALRVSGHRTHAGVIGWSLLVICALAACAAAFACWAAPRALMRRIGPLGRELSFAAVALAVVAAAMVVVTAATAVYLAALLVDTPGLAASANGPHGLSSTTTSIAGQLIIMLALSAAAALSASRGLHAVRAAHA